MTTEAPGTSGVPEAERGSPTRRRVLRAMLVGLTLLLALWVAGYAAAGEGLPRGTTVLGVPIGGLSARSAQAKLTRELRDEAAAHIVATVDGESFTMDPHNAGLRLDVAATVAQAGGSTWNPLELGQRLMGGREVDPVIALDEAKLTRAVDELARRADRRAIEGSVRFAGAAVVSSDAVPGRALRKGPAVEILQKSYLGDSGPIELAARPVKPRVSQAEVDRAVREFAEPAVSAPVTLVIEGRSLDLAPAVIGPALTMKDDGTGRLLPDLDGTRLKKLAAETFEDVEVKGVDATFRVSRGKPVVVPSRQGRAIDPLELDTAVLPVLTKTGAARTATVSLKISDPEVTTEEARALGVTELVSTYTTYYPSNFQPRLTNIHTAADYMDNTLVLPGEVFSMNKEVGERTGARGFAAGYVISNGKLAVDYGGGVSQLATTTFNAMFFAGLEDVEHHPHSFYISRYPEGREATVAWGSKDLRFRNDSGHGIFITTSHTRGSVTVSIYGTKIYRIEATKSGRYDIRGFETVHDPRPAGTRPGDCVLQEGVVGFKVDVTRLFYIDGAQTRSERFHTVYQPEDRVICGSNGPRAPVVVDPAD